MCFSHVAVTTNGLFSTGPILTSIEAECYVQTHGHVLTQLILIMALSLMNNDPLPWRWRWR